MKQENKINVVRIPWNKKRLDVDEILRLYFKEKMSCQDIANKMNCSACLINNKIGERGFKLRTLSEARKLKNWGLFGVANPMYGKKSWNRKEINNDEIIRLYFEEKKSCTCIAKLMGCSTTPIYRILRENNIKIENSGFFKKGNVPWNKDKNHPKYKEYIEIVRESGKNNKGNLSPFKGRHHTEESNRKNRENHIGKKALEKTKLLMSNQRKGKKKTKEWKENIGLAHLGRKRPFEDRKKMSAGKQGIPLEKWEKFVSKEPYDQNWTPEFRRAIRKRDNQVCMLCGIHREKLNRALDVHHINYDKKLSMLQNCISLCRKCHNGVVHKDDKNKEEKENWIKLFQGKLTRLYNYQYSEKGEIILEIKNEN